MPANLTQQYHKAEQAYRSATSPTEELACLQDMLRELPKHKGTDKLQAELKQKISRLKKELSDTKATGKRAGFRLPKQGAGRAVIIGAPNVGKSQLLSALTRATPEVADYPFTTREPQPGMMEWEDVMVQLVDTPPITADLYTPEVQSMIRSADLVVLVADLGTDDGGADLATVIAKVNESKTKLAPESSLDQTDIGISYTATFISFNKSDLEGAEDRYRFFQEYLKVDFDHFLISAQQGSGLEKLRERIYRHLDVVRVYTKQPAKKLADLDKPFTLPRGGTLQDLARIIHNDLADQLKSAKVWGVAVHDGTMVKGDYVLHDKDIVEIHT